MATVDNLEVKIHASATQAVNAVDKLSNKLGVLSKTLQGIDSNGVAKFAQGMNQLAQGMNALKNVKMPDFNRAAKGLKQFENVNSAKLNAVASSIMPLATAISTLGNIQFNNKSLTNFINALTRLSNANVNNINTGALGKLGNAIVRLSWSLQSAKKVSTNTIQLVNALGRLANAGQKATVVASTMPRLTSALKTFMRAMSMSPQIAESTMQMTQALAQLANAGKKTAQTASGLNQLAVALKKFMQVMSTAPKVSESTIRMTQALAQLAAQGSKTASASRGIQNSFSGMTKKMKIFSGIAGSVKNAFAGIGGSAQSTKTHVMSLASVVGKLYATFWAAQRVLSGFKKAIDISSDLTEVQNVVVNTFGQYTDKLEQFSKTSIKMYGMSELSAKQTASRFQAMGLAMGAPVKDMSDMSIQLTSLSADLASFYNISQEESSRKLWSIFTGETEPMRAFGIDLTNATLKEYAMKKGLDANISSMSQLEKTMLRYQYVMDNTKNVQGDFARTSQTWANQLRILQEQIKAVAGVWGNAFVNMLKPLVQALNKALSAVYTFSEKVVNALGAIFGWKIEIQKGSISDDFASAADAADDAASGTKKAAKAAKELKTHLLGIDELNVVEPDKDTGTSGSGGSGGGSSANGAGSDNGLKYKVKETESLYKSSIKSLEQLGTYISNNLSKAMESINWRKIYNKASSFGKGLAEFLNGLIKPRLFKNLGKTIAGSLNTVMYAVFSFSAKFDWFNFGDAFRQGIEKFLDTIYAFDMGRTAARIVKGIATSVYALVSKKNTWSKLGLRVSEGINGAILEFGRKNKKSGLNGWETLIANIFSISSGVTSTIDTAINNIFFDASLNDIDKALKKIDWNKVYKSANNFGINLGKYLNRLMSPTIFNDLSKTIAGLLNVALNTVFSLSTQFNWYNFGETLRQSINTFLSTYDFAKTGFTLGNIAKGIATSLYALVSKPDTWNNLGAKIGEGISAFFEALGQKDLTTKLSGGQALGKSISSIVNGIINALNTAIKTVDWNSVGKTIGEMISSIDWEQIVFNLAKLAGTVLSALSNAITGLNDTSKLAGAILTVIVGLKFAKSTKLGTSILDALGESILGGSAAGLQGSLNKKLAGLTLAISGASLGISETTNPTKTGTISSILALIGGGALLGGWQGALVGGTAGAGYKVGNYAYKDIKPVQKAADFIVKLYADEMADKYGLTKSDGTKGRLGYGSKWIWEHSIVGMIQERRFQKALSTGTKGDGKGGGTHFYTFYDYYTSLNGKKKPSQADIKKAFDSFETLRKQQKTKKEMLFEAQTLVNGAKTKNPSLQLTTLNQQMIKGWKGSNSVFDAKTATNGKLTPTNSVLFGISNSFSAVWKGKNTEFGANTAVNGTKTADKSKVAVVSNAFTGAWKGKETKLNANTAINGVKASSNKQIASINSAFTGAWKDKNATFSANTAVNGTLTKTAQPVKTVNDLMQSKFTGKDVTYNIQTQDDSTLKKLGENAASQIYMGMSDKEIKFRIKNAPDPLKEAMSGSFSFMPTYATGGFPEDGWFRASQGEVMGKFDNGKSVVANNEQITAGIASGVRQAVDNALTPYLSQIAQNTRETADKDTSINIDGRTLVNEADRRRSRNGYQFTTA